MLEKMGDKGQLLSMKDLYIGGTIEKITKLQYYKFGTVAGSGIPYVRFVFKDINNGTISGICFDVNPNEASIYLKRLKGNLVSIIGAVTEYQEKLSIRISTVEHITLSNQPELELLFSLEVENMDEYQIEIEAICKDFDYVYNVPFMHRMKTLSLIYGGLRGGSIKFINSVIRFGSSYLVSPGVNATQLLKVLVITTEALLFKLDLEETAGFVDSLTYFNRISRFKEDYVLTDAEYGIIFDAAMAIADFSKAVHPYSVVANKIIKACFDTQEIISLLPTMVVGESMRVGDSSLTAY